MRSWAPERALEALLSPCHQKWAAYLKTSPSHTAMHRLLEQAISLHCTNATSRLFVTPHFCKVIPERFLEQAVATEFADAIPGLIDRCISREAVTRAFLSAVSMKSRSLMAHLWVGCDLSLRENRLFRLASSPRLSSPWESHWRYIWPVYWDNIGFDHVENKEWDYTDQVSSLLPSEALMFLFPRLSSHLNHLPRLQARLIADRMDTAIEKETPKETLARPNLKKRL